MSDILEVKGVWKAYRRGADKQAYMSLRDRLSKAAVSSNKKESFYALEDIHLKVKEGESLALIGKNGAGKSTLLKILSRITPPSKGEMILRGRLASLLEVGTGFHPELTGKENIYLNGSILGLRRAEIEQQMEAIVEFSGVKKFLNTPLKHYSSGMQLRLAFAVAAHLEPEILVIDEVLAVGDHEFQQRCLKKMKDVSEQGRTVIFVSHNMNILHNLCTRGVLLEKGKITMDSDIGSTISRYMESSQIGQSTYHFDGLIRQVDICSDSGKSGIEFNQGLQLDVRFETENALSHPVLGMVIKDEMGGPICGFNNRHFLTENLSPIPIEKGLFRVKIPGFGLVPGRYSLDLYLGDRNVDIDKIEGEIMFHIADLPITPSGHSLNKSLNRVFPDRVQWELIDH